MTRTPLSGLRTALGLCRILQILTDKTQEVRSVSVKVARLRATHHVASFYLQAEAVCVGLVRPKIRVQTGEGVQSLNVHNMHVPWSLRQF